MTDNSPIPAREHEFEGDYRPPTASARISIPSMRASSRPMLAYLMQLTDALNTTLDLQTLLNRTSELVRAVIHYRIFAIFLLNDRTHDLRMRFQIGHTPEVERMRIPIGKGVVGQVALTRQPMLLNDVSTGGALHRRQSRGALRAGGAADRQEPPHRRDGYRKRAGRTTSAPSTCTCSP